VQCPILGVNIYCEQTGLRATDVNNQADAMNQASGEPQTVHHSLSAFNGESVPTDCKKSAPGQSAFIEQIGLGKPLNSWLHFQKPLGITASQFRCQFGVQASSRANS